LSPSNLWTKGLDSVNSSVCKLAEMQARRDWNAGKGKYYVFGIVAASAKERDMLKQKYGLLVVSMGCVVSSKELCFNKAIDQLMLQKTGKTVSELRTSSLLKNKTTTQ